MSKPLSVREKATVAIAAIWVAGFVDTTGYLLISEILTANMTGNSVRVAIGAAAGNWFEVAQRGWPLVMFIAGLIVSAMIHEAGARRSMLSTSAITFGMEAALLTAFEIYRFHTPSAYHLKDNPAFFLMVALLAFAMGLQNATITRVGALTVKTTHVTGLLTKFAEHFSQYLFWLHDHARRQAAGNKMGPPATGRQALRDASLMASLWLSFALGGMAGALTNHFEQQAALAAPIFVLVLLIGLDLVRPIAASEEHPRES